MCENSKVRLIPQQPRPVAFYSDSVEKESHRTRARGPSKRLSQRLSGVRKCSAHTAALAGVKANDGFEPLIYAVESNALICPKGTREHDGSRVSSSNVTTSPTFGIVSDSNLEHSVGLLHEAKPLFSAAS